ncbi:2Fe-2S iron-sulfur cluster-binding protein [Pseudomonas aeruginosa]|uniref:2Fe-2S iron-sulfur cluster-binding protein n=1 Tax=Pseudomonas aeruginosa TaxID=287 RepID=UPI0031B70BE7
MPVLIYVESNGTSHQVEAASGQNLMQVALKNLVPGILGDCGGLCSCATCHVLIDEPWIGKLSPMSESESFLIEGIPGAQAGSRLSCQVKVQDSMDGMIVHLPEEQF